MIAVLLVEDDDGDALIVDDLLSDALPSAQIARSRTFADALTQLDEHIDCVLLDLKLPDAQGMDTVVRIRRQAPDTPLIVLTGLHDEAAGIAAVDAGAQDYLLKGDVDGTQLARAIRYAIVRRQAAHAQQQLRVADAQQREVARLERGLAPGPLVSNRSLWIASQYHSGRNRALLGGDFFDVAETPNGHLRAVIGDVCGHGPDEAAVGVCLRAAWRALTVASVDSQLALSTLEQVIEHERHLPLLFATLCTLDIRLPQASTSIMLAGHPPPILIDGGSVSALTPAQNDPPVGLGGGSWSATQLQLPSAWVMLLYTDGITEAKIGGGPQRLGTDGLCGLITEHIASNPGWRGQPDELLAALIARAQQLNGGTLTDDVAMLLIGSHAENPRSN
jgi:serine phosphatase RsbU (regulator of sigma subunit)